MDTPSAENNNVVDRAMGDLEDRVTGADADLAGLAARHEIINVAVQSNSEPSLGIDRAGQIVCGNAALEESLNVDMGDLLGGSIHCFWQGTPDRPEYWDDGMARGMPIHLALAHWTTRAGESIAVAVEGWPVKDNEQRVIGSRVSIQRREPPPQDSLSTNRYFDDAPTPLAVYEQTLGRLCSNRLARESLGLTADPTSLSRAVGEGWPDIEQRLLRGENVADQSFTWSGREWRLDASCREDERGIVVQFAFRDVTAHRKTELAVARVQASQLRRLLELQTALDLAPVGMAIASDGAGQQISLNASGAELFRVALPTHERHVLLSQGFPCRFYQDGKLLERQPIAQVMSTGQALQNVEMDAVFPDGLILNLLVNASSVRDERGQAKGCVAVFVDITDRRQTDIALRGSHRRLEQAYQELEGLACFDGLTGVANRRHFDDRLAAECRRAQREATPLSLVMIDIDFFKDFNDRYGHLAGDDCLRRVAATMKGNARRPTDIVARYGGEEFAVVLPGADAAGAARLAESIRRSVEQLGIDHAGSTVASVVTVSLGAATLTLPIDESSTAWLLRAADQALYDAKRRGRNQFVHAP